jgi:hypothetical protein
VSKRPIISLTSVSMSALMVGGDASFSSTAPPFRVFMFRV